MRQPHAQRSEDKDALKDGAGAFVVARVAAGGWGGARRGGARRPYADFGREGSN